MASAVIVSALVVSAVAFSSGCAPAGMVSPGRDGSELRRIRFAYFSTVDPKWRFGMNEAELPWAVKEIDVEKIHLAYFIATFDNTGNPINVSGELIGPGDERMRFSRRLEVQRQWLWVGWSHYLPVSQMRQNPGRWTLQLSVDGQRAGRYTVLAGDAATLATLRGTPTATAAVGRTQPPARTEPAVNPVERRPDPVAPPAATVPPLPKARPSEPSRMPVPLLPQPGFRIDISTPPDRARVADKQVRLAARVESEEGVAGVSVTLNGVEVFDYAPSRPPSGLAVDVMLDLQRGTNEVVVRAVDASGSTQQATRSIELVTRP